MTVLTAMYVPALVVFLRGINEARRFDDLDEHRLAAAHRRLAMAQQAWESGALRIAIIDASAAVDLAQSAGTGLAPDERCELDRLRRRRHRCRRSGRGT